MARRINLDRKQTSSNFHTNKNTYPFLYEEETSQDNYEENEQRPDTKEIAKNVEKNLGKAAVGYATGNTASVASGAGNAINNVKDLNTSEKIEVASQVYFDLIKKKHLTRILLIIIPIVLFMFLIIFMIAAISGENNNRLATGGYYAMRCPEVTVIFVDKSNGYTPIGTETYPLEEYIAGVIRGEVLSFNNLETFKEFAILARTYLLTHDNNCTIEASDRKQVFKRIEDSPAYSELVYQAVEETKGQVLLENNELKSVQYDAFACIAEDNNYYTISQANQKIPKAWIEARINKASTPNWYICNGRENLVNHHGNGVSAWGSQYLATQENYKYDEILKFYLGDDITISTGGFMTDLVGLEIKDTTDAPTLYTALSSHLPSKGTSVEELNAYIHNSVNENGAGTRAGVVAAAVSLINFLHDAGGVKLPYYWNGKYQRIGINPNFGGVTTTSSKGHTHAGFDCSGFVSWAIMNGGYRFNGASTREFENYSYGDSCSIKDSSCIGQPGDLINEYNVHVQLIVSVDEASGIYYIAESSYGLSIHAVGMHDGSSNKRILHMDSYYNNSANVNHSY